MLVHIVAATILGTASFPWQPCGPEAKVKRQDDVSAALEDHVRAFRPLALAAAGALVLSACSGGESVDTGGGDSGAGDNVLIAAVSASRNALPAA